jgi:hypothetical protein
MKKAVDLVDTEYVALLADDEFFIPSSLERCIEMLMEKKEFIACMGRCLGFYYLKSGIRAKPVYVEMKEYGIETETARERMITHMNPYIPSTIYAVMHAKMWKKSMMILAEEKYTFTSAYVGELQFELVTCYQGKSIVIEDLMWLRNKYNKPVTFDKHSRKLQFNTWLKDPRYRDEVNFFYESTTTELSRIDGADKEIVLEDFKSAVEAYLDYCKNRRLLFSVATLRDQIMQFVPEKLKQKIHIARINHSWKPIMEEAQNMQKDGVTVDMKQLKEIVEFMEKNV